MAIAYKSIYLSVILLLSRVTPTPVGTSPPVTRSLLELNCRKLEVNQTSTVTATQSKAGSHSNASSHASQLDESLLQNNTRDTSDQETLPNSGPGSDSHLALWSPLHFILLTLTIAILTLDTVGVYLLLPEVSSQPRYILLLHLTSVEAVNLLLHNTHYVWNFYRISGVVALNNIVALFCILQTTNIILVALDRAACVYFAGSYKEVCTQKRVVASLVCLWVLCSALIIPLIITWGTDHEYQKSVVAKAFFAMDAVFMLITISCYLYLFVKLRPRPTSTGSTPTVSSRQPKYKAVLMIVATYILLVILPKILLLFGIGRMQFLGPLFVANMFFDPIAYIFQLSKVRRRLRFIMNRTRPNVTGRVRPNLARRVGIADRVGPNLAGRVGASLAGSTLPPLISSALPQLAYGDVQILDGRVVRALPGR